VTDSPPRIETDEQREWLRAAQYRGGLCAACGRVLRDDEPVYVGRVAIVRKQLAASGARWFQRAAYRDARLGEECASPEFLARTRGHEPEMCEGCGRPVYYEVGREGRRRASCSKRCANRASGAVCSGKGTT
jgi:hypothetical protein